MVYKPPEIKDGKVEYDDQQGGLLVKPDGMPDTNKALELDEINAPFLTPVGSDDSELIKTVAEFALELTPAQNDVLTRLSMLCLEPELPDAERKKIRLKIEMFIKNKRYHDAKFFISDALQSVSWRRFATAGQIQGNIVKSGQAGQ